MGDPRRLRQRARLVVEGRVFRERLPEPGKRPPKASWVVHAEGCRFANGCEPLGVLADSLTETGIMVRLRNGLIARCVTCRPTLIERIDVEA